MFLYRHFLEEIQVTLTIILVRLYLHNVVVTGNGCTYLTSDIQLVTIVTIRDNIGKKYIKC